MRRRNDTCTLFINADPFPINITQIQHEILASTASRRSVILCGHTNSKRGYLPFLAEKLRAEMAKEALEVEVVVSEEDRDPAVLV